MALTYKIIILRSSMKVMFILTCLYYHTHLDIMLYKYKSLLAYLHRMQVHSINQTWYLHIHIQMYVSVNIYTCMHRHHNVNSLNEGYL